MFFRASFSGPTDPRLRISCGIMANQTTGTEKRTASSPTTAVSSNTTVEKRQIYSQSSA